MRPPGRSKFPSFAARECSKKRRRGMETLEVERERLRRAKEIIATTKSLYLKRDLQKYVHRAERKAKKKK